LDGCGFVMAFERGVATLAGTLREDVFRTLGLEAFSSLVLRPLVDVDVAPVLRACRFVALPAAVAVLPRLATLTVGMSVGFRAVTVGEAALGASEVAAAGAKSY